MPRKLLVPLDLADAEPPPAGTAVQHEGTTVGRVTSAARGPTVGRTVALALLKREACAPGTLLDVGGEAARVRAPVELSAPG